MTSCIQNWVFAKLSLGAISSLRLQLRQSAILPSLERLGVNDFEARNFLIPFQQGSHAAGSLTRTSVQLPNCIDHVIAVSVQNVSSLVSMPGEVILDHS